MHTFGFLFAFLSFWARQRELTIRRRQRASGGEAGTANTDLYQDTVSGPEAKGGLCVSQLITLSFAPSRERARPHGRAPTPGESPSKAAFLIGSEGEELSPFLFISSCLLAPPFLDFKAFLRQMRS